MAKSVNQRVKQGEDREWASTERSEDAEEALEREYHYHMGHTHCPHPDFCNDDCYSDWRGERASEYDCMADGRG